MATIAAASIKIGGMTVGPVGYGLMSLTMPWNKVDLDAGVKLLKHALENGANFWNGALFYGTPEANSTQLVRRYFETYPEDVDKVVLSIKGCLTPERKPVGSPEAIRASVQQALDGLNGKKKIDIFAMARVDPDVPIEASIKALGELVDEGEIGGIGLSEVSANTIRRASALRPIAAVEIELSLFTPDPLRNGIMQTCQELSIPVVAYSPIGRGNLSASFKSLSDLAPDDFRRRFPRFQPGVFEQNVKLVNAVEELAKKKGCTTAQVAIGWVAQQGAIPIPGSSKAERVAENSKLVTLTESEMEEVKRLMEQFPVTGERYGGELEKMLNG